MVEFGLSFQETIKGLKERIVRIPGEIRGKEAKLIFDVQNNEAVDKRIKELKAEMYRVVSEEKETGRKRYLDASSIDAETIKRWKNSQAYKDAESKIYSEVTNELEGDKKKYSNENLRKTETDARLADHAGLKAFRMTVKDMVESETEEDKFRFPTERAKEVEIDRRLSDNNDYKELIDSQKKIIEEVSGGKVEVDYLKHEFKSYELLIKVMEIEK